MTMMTRRMLVEPLSLALGAALTLWGLVGPAGCGDAVPASPGGGPDVPDAGVTGATCPGGESVCDHRCVDLATSPVHCGDCGTDCGDGACLAGTCICGAAGGACPAGARCAGDTCVCKPGTAPCGAACVDTGSDPQHCGDCFVACSGSEVCAEGTCQSYFAAPTCDACPCPQCGVGTTCCTYPGGGFPVCVQGSVCPG
jgi:hypothetical protein